MATSEHQQFTTVPAAASTAVAALITGPAQPAQIIADFPVARYLAVDGAVVALVTPDAARLPNALVCHELPPPVEGDHVTPRSVIAGAFHRNEAKGSADHVGAGLPLVGDGCVQFGRARVVVGRWWDPVPRLPPVDDLPELAEAVGAMRSLLPGWPSPDEPAAEQLIAGRRLLADALAGEATPAVAADQLVGLGPGLTPAGDDLLAGAVAGLVLFGRAVGRPATLDLAKNLASAVDERAVRTTVLAADLARHAATGAVAGPVATASEALAGRRPLESALDRLLAIGHTSGRDLAEGLLLGATAAITT